MVAQSKDFMRKIQKRTKNYNQLLTHTQLIKPQEVSRENTK